MILENKGYLSAPIQLDLFQTTNITQRIETGFSQLNNHFMMIRNYAKQLEGFFTRIAAKVDALTMMQYFNFFNHKPIGQVKKASNMEMKNKYCIFAFELSVLAIAYLFCRQDLLYGGHHVGSEEPIR